MVTIQLAGVEADASTDGSEAPVALAQVVRFAAAAGSLGAAAVHASAIAEHTFSALHTLAFIAMTIFQASWAYLVLRSITPRVLLAGAIGHGSILVAWLATRTSGVPEWLPGPGGREVLGLKDLAAGLLAAGAIACIDVLSRRDLARRMVRASRAGAAIAAAVVVALLIAVTGAFAVGHQHGVAGPHADAGHGDR